MDQSRQAGVEDNLLEVIARSLENLRKSDRRVAEWILNDPESAVDLTLGALARAAEVSEPTVIRFANAVGCEGFRDLRVKLARSIAFARTTSHSAIAATDELDAIVGKIFDFNLSNITWVRAHLDSSSIAAAVDALSRAPRIEFFGMGASGIVALDAAQKFPLFGVPCSAQTDGHQMLMAASMMRPGDVAVGISNTGQTEEVVRALRVAGIKGAITIAITGGPGPLHSCSAIPIVAQTLENTNVFTPTVSRLSAMIVIDILSTAVSLARGSAEQDRILEMKRLLSTVRSGQHPGFATAPTQPAPVVGSSRTEPPHEDT